MNYGDMKFDFDTVLEKLADGHSIDRADVLAHALKRKVWIAEWHIPGCMSESRDICLTKKDAIESAVAFTGADGDDAIEHKIRGIRTALRRDGFFQHHTEMFGHVNTTIECCTLGDLL